jgi:hypothetical protein
MSKGLSLLNFKPTNHKALKMKSWICVYGEIPWSLQYVEAYLTEIGDDPGLHYQSIVSAQKSQTNKRHTEAGGTPPAVLRRKTWVASFPCTPLRANQSTSFGPVGAGKPPALAATTKASGCPSNAADEKSHLGLTPVPTLRESDSVNIPG